MSSTWSPRARERAVTAGSARAAGASAAGHDLPRGIPRGLVTAAPSAGYRAARHDVRGSAPPARGQGLSPDEQTRPGSPGPDHPLPAIHQLPAYPVWSMTMPAAARSPRSRPDSAAPHYYLGRPASWWLTALRRPRRTPPGVPPGRAGRQAVSFRYVGP